MSILTNADLRKILCLSEEEWNAKKALLIKSFSKDCLTTIGYDLRVGGYYKTYGSTPSLIRIKKKEKVVIKPGETALIATLEEIKMPEDCSISALLVSRVSQVARGLSHISTKIDPNWVGGSLSIAVNNFSRETICLEYEEKICSVVFFENKSNPKQPPKIANIDRFNLAQSKKSNLQKILTEYAPITIVIIIPVIAYFRFGEGLIFTGSIPIAVALYNFLEKKFGK